MSVVLIPGRRPPRGLRGDLARRRRGDPRPLGAPRRRGRRRPRRRGGRGRRAGLRRQHRLRQARERHHRRRRHRAAPAQPHPLALLRRRRPDAPPVVRLMMALKLLSLGRGASGVRWPVVELIEGMLARGVTPRVPAQGSVGASGDLAPLAHMAAVMIGEGEATVDGRTLPGAEALAAAGLAPRDPRPEGGPRPHQRHPVLDRARPRRPLRRLARRPVGAARLLPLHRRDHGLHRAAQARDPRPARPPRPDRGRRRHARHHGGLGDPREPPDRRHPRPGPLLHPLPAPGHRRRHGPAAPGRRHPRRRGERRHRQPAGARGRPSSPAATSTPSRWPSPPT
jgi:hypothetical protein